MAATYCNKCGTALQAGAHFCPNCGAEQVYSPTPPYQPAVVMSRREMRAQRRAERPGPHLGGLIVATILIAAGLAAFYPDLPWQFFWGGLLILLGVWIAGLWTFRGSRHSTQAHDLAS